MPDISIFELSVSCFYIGRQNKTDTPSRAVRDPQAVLRFSWLNYRRTNEYERTR